MAKGNVMKTNNFHIMFSYKSTIAAKKEEIFENKALETVVQALKSVIGDSYK